MLKIKQKDKERFWKNVDVRNNNECWNWNALRNPEGYGRFGLQYKNWRAHRLSWMLANNKEIPEGMCILHKCDNPSCVNPAHLWLGTDNDNVQDAYNKGRKNDRGENSARSKLTREQVVIIKKAKAEAKFKYGDKVKFCKYWGMKFNVSWHTIEHILYDQRWSHIKI